MSSEGIPVLDTMTETLTPHDAARVLAQASRYEEALFHRTEGLTVMIWGLVSPAIFLAYAYAERASGFPDWGYALLWFPWVAAGGLVTFALWRSAGLAMPNMHDPITPAGYALRFLSFVLILVVIFIFWQPHHYGAPLLIIGGGYVALATINPYLSSRQGRVMMGTVGLVLLAAAAVMLAIPHSDAGFTATLLIAGLVPLGGGLVQTLRG